MDDIGDLSFWADVPIDPPAPHTEPTTEDDIIGAVANVLADCGYRFIPDARLPEMKQAMLPFMVTD